MQAANPSMQPRKRARILVATFYVFRVLRIPFELAATLLYREMLKRNTLRPIRDLIKEEDETKRRNLLREWSQMKKHEVTYIQVAVCVLDSSTLGPSCASNDVSQGGFLFTTVASCLQWPSTQNGHWSAGALFYASILLAFAAIVMGSQQLLVLPSVQIDKVDQDLEEDYRARLNDIVERLCRTPHANRPNYFHVTALQMPFMVLSFSVLAFFGGLCSIIFAPLAKHIVWDDDAKVRIALLLMLVHSLIIGNRLQFFSAPYALSAWYCSSAPRVLSTGCSEGIMTINPGFSPISGTKPRRNLFYHSPYTKRLCCISS